MHSNTSNFKKSASKSSSAVGPTIVATLPYTNQDIPIIILFRALGFVSDKDILEHILPDLNDNEMLELLKPSLDEAFVVQVNFIADLKLRN